MTTEQEQGLLGHALPRHVYVTRHAITRLRERFPHFRDAPLDALVKMVQREISEAFRAGRVARTQPRWTIFNDATSPNKQQQRHGSRGKRSKGPRGTLFVWDHQEVRCYGVIRDRHEETGNLRVTVRTVLTSLEEST